MTGIARRTARWLGRTFLTTALLALSLSTAPALSPEERLDDPALEARARTLAAELRCLVCQNQSIDDSNAPLAQDLRAVVRERLLAGDSNDQTIAYITERYGDYVLMRPPVQTNTLLLWGGPAATLLLGGLIVAWALRRRTAAAGADAPDPLTPEERRQVDALLGRSGPASPPGTDDEAPR
ncbi:MAG: cytochrome c-type biogenesis protein CcmH [Alphaproteobacteria bacterium]|nr:cytochrome c-type biogenesis protein CcmH [Alphaproteobacteria bacterium]